MSENERCDYCGLLLHHDRDGWWVGPDDSARCSARRRGHEVDGRPF